jgi:hypothetical protein
VNGNDQPEQARNQQDQPAQGGPGHGGVLPETSRPLCSPTRWLIMDPAWTLSPARAPATRCWCAPLASQKQGIEIGKRVNSLDFSFFGSIMWTIYGKFTGVKQVHVSEAGTVATAFFAL